MSGHRFVVAAVLAVGFAMVGTPAVAQLCRGLPLVQGQTAFALTAGFPDEALTVGARAMNRVSGPLTLGVSYELTTYDSDLDWDNDHTIGALAAFELPVPALAAAGLELCPTGGVSYTTDGDLNILQIPLGIGVGGTFPVGDGLGLAPYAVPALYRTRASYDGASFSDTEFGVRAGANLLVNNLFFGALVDKVGDVNAVLGIQAGIVF